jgi:hypothetical protein
MKFVPCNRNQIILHTLTNNQNDSCTSWLLKMHDIKTNNQKLIFKNQLSTSTCQSWPGHYIIWLFGHMGICHNLIFNLQMF